MKETCRFLVGDRSLSSHHLDLGTILMVKSQEVLLMKLDVNAVRVAAELEKEASPHPFVNKLQQTKDIVAL